MRTVWRRGGLSTIHRSDSQGARLLTLAADTPRIERVEIRGHVVECLRSSPAFLQRILHTEDLSQEPWTGGATVTPNVVIAPDGELTGSRLADTSAGELQAREQSVQVLDDEGWFQCSFFVRRRTGPLLRVQTRFHGGESVFGGGWFNPETGEMEGGHGNFVQEIGDWWRIWTFLQNNASGNTLFEGLIWPAAGFDPSASFDASATGFNDIWGVQIIRSRFRLPYQEAGDAQVAHPGDEAYFSGWPTQLRDTLLYVDGFAFGARSSDEGNPRLFTVGDRLASGTVTASLVHTPAGALELHVSDVAVGKTAVSGLTLPPEGGPFEAVLDFDRSGGTIRLYAQVGETAGVGAPVSADLSGDWNSDKLRIGHYLDSIFVHEPASVGHYRHLAVDRAAVPPSLLADAEGLIAHLRDAAGRFGPDGKLLSDE